MIPFGGAPKNNKKPLPSTEREEPEAQNEGQDLESLISGLGQDELLQLQDMISARLETFNEEPLADESAE